MRNQYFLVRSVPVHITLSLDPPLQNILSSSGDTCGMCSVGYYGDATNAGQCRLCECGELTTGECEPRTGACTCNTNGVTGHGCNSCAGGFMKSTVPIYWGGGVTEMRETCLQILQLETSSRNVMKGTLDRVNIQKSLFD